MIEQTRNLTTPSGTPDSGIPEDNESGLPGQPTDQSAQGKAGSLHGGARESARASSANPADVIDARFPEHRATSPLSIHDMTVAYHRTPVLWDIDFDAPPGKLIAIIGPNGSGKTTLIKAALGLIPKASGRVLFFGQPLKKARSRLGYVPQRESVDWDFPINALHVAAMGLYRRIGWFRPVTRKYRKLALEALDRVGMADYATRQIRQLSGGQQQRVFLARALVQDADLYLMDEPFVGVDAATERAIVDILRDLRGRGKTAIVVHHDLQTAPEYFDEAILLNMRLVARGPMEQVFTEDNLKKTYGGKLALLDRVGQRIGRGEVTE